VEIILSLLEKKPNLGIIIALFFFLVLIPHITIAQLSPEDSLITEKFELKNYQYVKGTMDYRFFTPEVTSPTEKYPLVLTLHGAGDDKTNWAQIRKQPLAYVWARDSNQQKHPCFIVSPRKKFSGRWVNRHWKFGSYSLDSTPISEGLKSVMEILDFVVKNYPIDTNRIYLTGLSMGGFGTWDLAMRYPDKFAAIGAMAGSADPTKAMLLKDLPIWTTHGTADKAIPVKGSRDIVYALEDIGKKTLYTHCNRSKDCTGLSDSAIVKGLDTATLIYSEYDKAGHVAAWRDEGKGYDNPLFVGWMFKQQRNKLTGVKAKRLLKRKASFPFVKNGKLLFYGMDKKSTNYYGVNGKIFVNEIEINR